MSQINVQRRMRPAISHFIRTILYPNLQDHSVVTEYPPVQGMQTDVFFLNHLNKENGTEDSVSKFNMFEVDMIRDLVVYFLRQGTYNGPGDIAVLCAYLGQLQKVRAALRDLKIAVAVDERDAEQLARQGLEDDSEVQMEEVVVAKHVRLGTVDIFQGQEAKIVIVSLVRNSGQPETGRASIGFLKSPNRINVALSRAKHGLYIFGNVANLRQNPTWSTILNDMEDRGQIASPAFPGGWLRLAVQRSAGLWTYLSFSVPCRIGQPSQHEVHGTLPSHPLSAPTPLFKVVLGRLRQMHVSNIRGCTPLWPHGLESVLLDDLASVKCFEQVRKELPGSMSPEMCTPGVLQALLGTVHSMHEAVRVVVPSLHLPTALRLCMLQAALRRAVHENKTDSTLVDLMMPLRLSGIDSRSTDSVRNRLITLACGHTFTVQTLDRHCGMQEYYDVDPTGRFIGLKLPSVDFQRSPTCPTCRGPITALRYGRITKRAAMDILEQNVARAASVAIDELTVSVSSYSSKLSDYQAQAREIVAETTINPKANTLAKPSVQFTQSGPLPAENAFTLGAMQKVHGFAVEEARAWRQIVKDIVNTYRAVVKVANVRGPHVETYEAAVSTLKDEDRVRATDASAGTVSEIVERKSRVEGLSKTSNAPDTARHHALWTSFVSFLYDSCVADAKKAAALAKGCPTPRHATRAAIYEVQFAFDAFRWKTMCERAELSRAGALDAAARERLQRKAADYKLDLARRSQQLEKSHMGSQPSQTMVSSREERRWMEENCGAKVAAVVRECIKLEAELVTPSAVHNRAIAQMRLEEDFVQRRPSGSTSIGASRSGSSDQSSCVVA
uniref:Transcriptional repressor TUP1 n=1 Tax=Ganoderma boninense TaxID=34458 RepID=A0A5K1JY96_9APHY|nr:Transcriptional repressor TUP1 [Ganoderma boninense]